MMRKLLPGILLIVTMTGCSFREADFTVLSNRNVDLSQVEKARKTQNPVPAVGKDPAHKLLLFIPISGGSLLEDAVDRTLDKGNGDCLVDVVVHRYWWWVPPFYLQCGWKVTGRPISTYSVQSAETTGE